MRKINKIGELIVNPKAIKRYDLIVSHDTILSYIGVRKPNNQLSEILVNKQGIVKIKSNFTNIKNEAFNYKPLNTGKYWGWDNFLLECKLIKRSKGVRPILKDVKKNYEELIKLIK